MEVMEYARMEENALRVLQKLSRATSSGTNMGRRAIAIAVTGGADYGVNFVNFLSQELNPTLPWSHITDVVKTDDERFKKEQESQNYVTIRDTNSIREWKPVRNIT